MKLEADTVVIGAGVVGLAIARALARDGRDVLVLEQQSAFGMGISSRNSEVIHAGLYYPEGSLKARLCTTGRRALYDYCASHGVPYRRCGKWVIATHPEQEPALAEVEQRAAANGVTLDRLSTRSRAAEPDLNIVAGLASPETGIIDSHQLMLALIGELEDAGGRVAYNAPVEFAEARGTGHLLRVGGELECEILCRQAVNAAGLNAAGLARQWGGFDKSRVPALHMARGHYFSYSGAHPFTRLIYPVPEPGGLGIHLTLDLAGQARFGPDVQWITQEDYQVPVDRAGHFRDSIAQWWRGFDPARLKPAYSGIRPKLSGPGKDPADFFIEGPEEHGIEGLVVLLGIESPGLTASLAISELVRDKLAH
ncbi:NAD(P)/FAD-dependent oxidoreductase [Hydrocarboniclastica marina]|uniref:NAD(P)/FAD-dependent oxidoreductase n=1 Tax=Hydrocarboniclastica marina TaxID=2259620 RepID=A0A4P7XHT1_9ALTE|nr:NAD(P)/FAD-dependent oxidoreductase [Hydrocarboniclastica marina]QCF26608.1 NAD(P)/FAD-dependent oxidoreductase [Hydrocarboniclastica marina]